MAQELFTNLASSTLAASLAVGATTTTVATGDGEALFPAIAGGSGDYFRCLLFNKTTGETEFVTVTARSGDILTVTRATESVGNAAATEYAFNAGDLIELRPTKGFYDSLASVTTTQIQSNDYNYAPDENASANDYAVILDPVPASYAAPMVIYCLAGATNTGASVFEVQDSGSTPITGSPKNITRLDGSTLRAGDIVTGKVMMLVFDGADFVLMNPRNIGDFDSGTVMVFYQANGPTGWTTKTDGDISGILGCTVRFRSGDGVAGGPVAGTHNINSPPTADHTHDVIGTSGNHALTLAQAPSHKHELPMGYNSGTIYFKSTAPFGTGGNISFDLARGLFSTPGTIAALLSETPSNGSNGAVHTHPAGTYSADTDGPTAFAPKYLDCILCEKD